MGAIEQVKFGIIRYGNASSYHILGIKKDPNLNIKFIVAYDINEKNLNHVSKRNYILKDFLPVI